MKSPVLTYRPDYHNEVALRALGVITEKDRRRKKSDPINFNRMMNDALRAYLRSVGIQNLSPEVMKDPETALLLVQREMMIEEGERIDRKIRALKAHIRRLEDSP